MPLKVESERTEQRAAEKNFVHFLVDEQELHATDTYGMLEPGRMIMMCTFNVVVATRLSCIASLVRGQRWRSGVR